MEQKLLSALSETDLMLNGQAAWMLTMGLEQTLIECVFVMPMDPMIQGPVPIHSFVSDLSGSTCLRGLAYGMPHLYQEVFLACGHILRLHHF
jgi:hypothetical protein